MTVGLVITLLLIGFIGSFLSGMLGIGGAIINYPMLLFLPALLGVAHYSAHEVSGMIAIQVFFASLSGVLALRKENVMNYRLIGYMGTAIIIGSLAGGYGGRYLPEEIVNMIYAILATIAAVMMLIPRKGNDDKREMEKIEFNRVIAVISAFIVGISSGVVGAGGAFILVPIMLTVLKIPARITIASSLAITFISSIGSSVGKLMAGHILLWPTVVIVLASVLAAPLGTKVSKRMNAKVLQLILAILIVGTAIKIWFDLLSK
ncbi:sulfite exporter TauE/SafE family protein [Aneurinibacillus uraniidurans]|uniref:sulfite exporter TauE/SafE family protein n=1 Tax=Aneurinibacillus uraniidurans TaxID=2966586 RepID=UPI00234955B1|nr:sulfite exporter TauE/SafE family protein [Aneurinibacillus sp. B1]WCN39202.1 sulfite exporter TauE/SafE family protein [Aneurinibacillus sp. B1]